MFPIFKIGVLDVDICGPSLPQVFGVQGEQVNSKFNSENNTFFFFNFYKVHQSGSGWSPIVNLRIRK